MQIYLPRTIEAKAPGPRRAVKPQTAEKAYVLVVDDDPDVRWITSEDLREIGYLVTEADSGRAALAILERGGPCDLKPVLPLDTLLNGIAAHPSLPEYWWLYALLLSTMIPSLVNLVIGGASLVRGLPGLPSLLLRKIPAQGNVPKFDRAWIATVLTAQVAAGAALGIAAQTFLVVVIIGYTMPWLGLGLLGHGPRRCRLQPAGAGRAAFRGQPVGPAPSQVASAQPATSNAGRPWVGVAQSRMPVYPKVTVRQALEDEHCPAFLRNAPTGNVDPHHSFQIDGSLICRWPRSGVAQGYAVARARWCRCSP